MKCKICGSNHKIEYHLVNKIPKKGYPTANPRYHDSHVGADRDEKRNYPKGYERLKKLDNKIPSNELIGKHTKAGKIEISKKVPKKDRPEVVFHEVDETKRMNKRKKK